MIIGYARVSTDGQTLDAQEQAQRNAGADRVFAEKVSGTVTDRRQLAKDAEPPPRFATLYELLSGYTEAITRPKREPSAEVVQLKARIAELEDMLLKRKRKWRLLASARTRTGSLPH
jgi:Resolvase, N terminal domain